MKEKIINKLISFLPSKDNKIKNIIFVVSCALFFAYSFSIPTFSNRYPFNYLSIALCGLMCVSMGVYVLLYGKFKIDIFSMMLILLNIIILISHIINMNFAQMPKTIILMSIVAFFILHHGDFAGVYSVLIFLDKTFTLFQAFSIHFIYLSSVLLSLRSKRK